MRSAIFWRTGRLWASIGLFSAILGAAESRAADDILPPISQRFAAADGQETPSFQRHVVNLFGRLGCNGRSCHGSFQGRGGLQLSLFGYDFQADHAALLAKDSPRIDVQAPAESLILVKPTDADMHEGGQRYEKGSWQYHVFLRWVQTGAKLAEQPDLLMRLEVTPAEIRFAKTGEQAQLQAVAVWEDGSREDVTPLCRFVTNDEEIAKIDDQGRVTSGEPGDTHVVVSYDNGVQAVPVLQPVSELVDARYPQVPTPTKIDELVVSKLRKLGVVPSDVCSDAEFLRRATLDLTGTLPAPKDVEAFLADASPDKRAKKIDQLLETPAYAAWWTTKLCDFTGNNDDQLVNATPLRGQASKDWYDWIYQRVAGNTPYDQLAAGIVTAVSRKPDQDYLDYCKQMSEISRKGSDKSYADLPAMTHFWARRDFRDADARAIAFAYSFMGLRIQCAQCHKHPFDQWSKDDFHQFKNFFAGVVAADRRASPDAQQQYTELLKNLGVAEKRGNDLQKELPRLLDEGKTVPFPEVFVARAAARGGKGGGKNRNPAAAAATAKLLGGENVDLTQHADPREVVMSWLRDKNNRFFAPAFVNRVWANYFHVGIVNPVDDLSLGNPPSNKSLLDYLAQGFIDSGFDMKWVHRQIANSRTYQLAWEPNETNKNDQRNFSRAVPRRLPAEVLYDAIQQATASDERIAKMQQDVSGRAIAIPGAGARNNRGGGAAYALTVFGRSTRESNCDCDRSAEASLLQTVYLQNDRDVLQLTDVRQGGWLEQIAKQLRPNASAPVAQGANAAKQIQSYRKQIEFVRARLVLKEGGSQEAVPRLQKRLAQLQKEIQRLTPQPPPEPKPAFEATAAADLESIVRQAYLRTVSRYPADDELKKSVAYIAQAEDPVDGVRDVLWALLNTKEFIVNH
jgi:hypothetical protein